MHRSELAHISQAALTWLVQSGLISREEWNPFNGSMNKTDWSECLLPTLRSDSVDSKLKRCKLWLPMISICSASFICHLIINLNILHPFSRKNIQVFPPWKPKRWPPASTPLPRSSPWRGCATTRVAVGLSWDRPWQLVVSNGKIGGKTQGF